MKLQTKKQRVELFFNTLDAAAEDKFIIYPKSLKKEGCKKTEDYEELLETTLKPFDEEWKLNGLKKVKQIEDTIKEYNLYPDPTKMKLTSKWYYGQILKGAVLFRYGYDGRKDEGSRYEYTIEGAYLEGIDLKKSSRKYEKKGIDIIERIGLELPQNIEEILIHQKRAQFEELKAQCIMQKNLNNLFYQFYTYFENEEMAIDKIIETYSLYRMCGDMDLNCVRKRIMKEMGLY